MADLGNLWFSLGLDDSKFEKQWQKAFAKYKNSAKINVDFTIDSKAIKELQKFSNAGMTTKQAQQYASLATSISKAAIAMEKLNREKVKNQALENESNAKIANRQAESLKRQALTQEKINSYIDKRDKANNQVTQGYKTQSLWLQNLSTLASNYFSLYAVKNFVTELARVSGEFEKQRVTLQAMVGEMQGLEIYGKMKELAVVSPFEFKDLANYAKQLAAFSVPYEELYDTTKRLADVSAGLGVDMSRIILAYGQIRSAGVLKGTELRQLTEAGVPILDKLAAKLEEVTGKSVSMGDVFDKISQKAISFEMVKEVFEDFTSAGGRFYNMQELQAETLAGKISNLKDAYSIMLSEIGEKTEGSLKGGVEFLYSFIDNWETLGRVIITVAAAYGTYQAAQIVALSYEKLKLIQEFAKAFLEAGLNLKKAAASMADMNLATKAGVWGAVLAAIVGVGTAIWQAVSASKAFNKELDKTLGEQTTKLEQETRAFNDLKEAIDGAAKGSQERRDAIKQFNNQYGSYLQNLLTETSTANELAIAYTNVTEALKAKNKQEALTRGTSVIEEEYGSRLNKTIGEVISGLKERGLSSVEAQDVVTLLKEYYKQGGTKLEEINKIIKDRVGEEVFKKAELGISNAFNSQLKTTLRQQVTAYENAIKELLKELDIRFDSALYSTKKEEELVNRVNKLYEERLDKLKKQDNLTEEQFEKEKKQIEILKRQELAEGYGAMGLTQMADKYEAEWDALAEKIEGWRGEFAEQLNKLGLKGLAPAKDDSYSKYVDKLREEYKSLNEEKEKYNNQDVDGGLTALKERIRLLKEFAKANKIILDPKGTKKAETQAEKDEKKRVNALKDQYNWVLKIAKSYEKLTKQGATSDVAKNAVLNTFTGVPEDIKTALEGSGDWTVWFAEKFKTLSDEAKKTGSEVGTDLADSILQGASTLNVADVIEALKLGEEIKTELEKWGLEDFALKGEGVTLDISKALRDLKVADNEAYRRRQELLDKISKAEKGDTAEIAALKEMYGDNWLKNAKDRAKELYELEISNNAKVAKDKIQDLAKSLAKETLYKTLPEGFMSSLSSKSVEQLINAKNALSKQMTLDPDFLFDAEFLDRLAAAEVDLDKFIELYKKYINLQVKDISTEIWDRNRDKILSVGQVLVSLLESMSQFSESRGKYGLSNFINGLKDTIGFAMKLGEALNYDEETGRIKIKFRDIVSLIAQVGAGLFNYFTKSKELATQAETSFISFANSVKLAKIEAIGLSDALNTIFGESKINSLKAWGDQIVKAWENINESIQNAGKINLSGGRYKDDSWTYLYDVRAELLATEELGSKIAHMTYSLGKKRFLFWNTTNYSKIGAEFPDLFKENGGLDFEYLDEFLEKAENLDDAQREFFQNLLDNYELYKEAMKNISDYLANIFSDTASTIADRMLESFAATGDAATNLGDLVSGVAKQIAKDLIQSMLVDQYLTPAMERIKALYNPQSKEYEENATLRTQKAILAMQDAISAAGEAVPEVNKLLQAIQDMGIDLSADSENASHVLSGLTEDQQNLLLSYINGIRADVSMNKGLLTSIVNSVGTISNNIATAIVVWKQIEANTHRSADGVDKIIGFFESVISPYDGGAGQALQVNIA